MLTVTFARHGETVSNAANVIQGHTHGELTERGISMAEHLGCHLSEEIFTRIYSSDLKRCVDTTLHILKHSKHHALHNVEDFLVLDEMLRERCFGDLELQPSEAIRKLCTETRQHYPRVVIPGGESFEDIKKRAGQFFHTLCKLADDGGGNILVVTHGGWLMCFLHYLVDNKDTMLNLHGFDIKLCKKRVHNTATTKIVIYKSVGTANNNSNNCSRKVIVKYVHDTQHLPNHLQQRGDGLG